MVSRFQFRELDRSTRCMATQLVVQALGKLWSWPELPRALVTSLGSACWDRRMPTSIRREWQQQEELDRGDRAFESRCWQEDFLNYKISVWKTVSFILCRKVFPFFVKNAFNGPTSSSFRGNLLLSGPGQIFFSPENRKMAPEEEDEKNFPGPERSEINS